jgi:hypothetical protein
VTALVNSWREVDLPPVFIAGWEAQMGKSAPLPHAYERGPLFALVSRDLVAKGDARWHVSVRYGEPGANGRVPTWDELVDAGHALRPGVAFVVGVPPRSWWINVHPHVLHLWETRDPHLTSMWRDERRGDRPS